MALRQKHQDVPASSNHHSSNGTLFGSWLSPKKVKIFLWRAAKDLLPTAENLWKKRVMQKATCPVCRSQMETLAHALLDYKIAKKVWKNSPFENPVQGKFFPDVINIIQSLPQQQNELNGELVASLLWTI